jgi:hypothetical protein
MAIMTSCCFSFIWMLKNPFNKILSLSFDLRPWKWTSIMSKGISFAKDYKKDSYNFKKWMGKKLRR